MSYNIFDVSILNPLTPLPPNCSFVPSAILVKSYQRKQEGQVAV